MPVCKECGQLFSGRDRFDFVCANCKYKKSLKEKEDKPLDPKDYKTSWGAN